MDRRDFIGAVAVGTALTAAGCVDLAVGDGIEETAHQATIAPSSLQQNGFVEDDVDEFVIDETIEVSDVERDVHITSWISTFRRADSDVEIDGDSFGFEVENESVTLDEIDDERLGLDAEQLRSASSVAIFSTVSAAVAGRELNPVAQFTDEELIDQVASEFSDGDIEEISEEETFVIESLGEDVEITKLNAVAVINEEEVELDVYTGEVTHEDDLLLYLGVHHTALNEEETVRDLFSEVEHPVEL